MKKHPVFARSLLEDDHLEPLVRGTLAGDAGARDGLWLAVDPAIETIAGRFRSLSRLDEREDERRDLVVGVMERLYADGFKRLALLHAVLLRREGAARAWLSTVTRRLAINRLEGHPENVGGRARAWVSVVPLPEGVEELIPASMRAAEWVEARRIRAHAERILSAPELQTLGLWCEGYGFHEIEKKVGLPSANAAELLMLAVIRRLRRCLGVD